MCEKNKCEPKIKINMQVDPSPIGNLAKPFGLIIGNLQPKLLEFQKFWLLKSTYISVTLSIIAFALILIFTNSNNSITNHIPLSFWKTNNMIQRYPSPNQRWRPTEIEHNAVPKSGRPRQEMFIESTQTPTKLVLGLTAQ